jgi:hypothetical protein
MCDGQFLSGSIPVSRGGSIPVSAKATAFGRGHTIKQPDISTGLAKPFTECRGALAKLPGRRLALAQCFAPSSRTRTITRLSRRVPGMSGSWHRAANPGCPRVGRDPGYCGLEMLIISFSARDPKRTSFAWPSQPNYDRWRCINACQSRARRVLATSITMYTRGVRPNRTNRTQSGLLSHTCGGCRLGVWWTALSRHSSVRLVYLIRLAPPLVGT